MKTTTLSAVLVTIFLSVSSAPAATILFDLQGKAGFGLLPGNENHAIAGTPGTGGEVGAGISLNDVTNVLTINIGWGSGQGFTDLSSSVASGHIHGPTASGGTASFTENANILIGLDSRSGWNASRTNGGFSGDVPLTSGQAADLLAGRLYINVHTSNNGGGEIRGNIVQVPEPGSAAAFGVCVLGVACRRRSRENINF